MTADELDEVVIAYEPVWAIGTGDSAKASDVKKATQMIRRHISHLYGKKRRNQFELSMVEVLRQ